MYEYKCKHCKKVKRKYWKDGYLCKAKDKYINHRCTNFWHLPCDNFTLNVRDKFLDWLDEKTT